MLTKDLVRNHIRKGRIYPKLIDPEDDTLLAIAQNLIDLFSQSIGQTRETLLDNSKTIISNDDSLLINKGLEKLLLDRTTFDTESDDALLAFRQRLFAYSNKLLSSPLAAATFDEFKHYQQQITDYFQQPHTEISHKLYSDLPPYQNVIEFKKISASELLHRYNCAQIQALLLHSEKIVLDLFNPKPEKLRQLFKYLRFHQLLANLSKPDQQHYQLVIDGPLSLFYKTQKYGMSLAKFFPAILIQDQWAIQADIQIRNRKPSTLKCDQTCGIKSHYQQFNAYIPEEIKWLQQRFNSKITEWTITPAKDFIKLKGEIYCFPDYLLKHKTGKKVYIELFHAWHASHLQIRLKQLEQKPKNLLILGVARQLLKNTDSNTGLDHSSYFQTYGFLFRELPTVDKIKPILQLLLKETS